MEQPDPTLALAEEIRAHLRRLSSAFCPEDPLVSTAEWILLVLPSLLELPFRNLPQGLHVFVVSGARPERAVRAGRTYLAGLAADVPQFVVGEVTAMLADAFRQVVCGEPRKGGTDPFVN